jgi:PadR family transcriptional regulator, regulatory protein PadR
VALGGVYAALERLEEKSLVGSELGEATEERGGRAKRYFHITASGLREVRAARRSLIEMWRGVSQSEAGTI